MKKLMLFITKILENPIINLIVAIGLIAIGIEQLYKEGVLNLDLHWKHGISIYGIFVLFQAIIKIAKGSVKLYNTEFGKRNSV